MLGKNTENNILLSMVLMVAVYMLVLITATHHHHRPGEGLQAMELLITSTKPTPDSGKVPLRASAACSLAPPFWRPWPASSARILAIP